MTQTATRTPEIVTTPIVTVSPILFDGSQEIWASYERSDNTRVDMSVLTPGTNDPSKVFVATMVLANNPNCDVAECIELSIAEARILRDLLNRPDVQAILDAQ